MNELALFAGGGGGLYASRLLGHTPVCAVEIDKHARNILLARQADGTFPRFPIWDYVRTFDGKPWAGKIDIVSGGFPCQDISIAGKGDGINGARSGLWSEFARIISEVRPRHAFIENSPALANRGLDQVLCDLAALGYDASWGVFSACSIGASHTRERMFILADAVRERHKGAAEKSYAPTKWQGGSGSGIGHIRCEIGRYSWWAREPGVGRVAYGVANWSHRIKSLGNGQVPAVAALAWHVLMEATNDR